MLRLLTITFALFLVGLVALANAGRVPALFGIVAHLPGGDATGHFLLIGAMAFLLNASLPVLRRPVGRFRLPRGSLILALVVTVEELSQLWLPARSFSWADLLGNYLGILILGGLGAFFFRERPRAGEMGARSP